MKKLPYVVSASMFLIGVGVHAIGIWAILLFAATPENHETLAFALSSLDFLLSDESVARNALLAMTWLGLLSALLAATFVSRWGRSLASTPLFVGCTLVLIVIAIVGGQYFPGALLLLFSFYYAVRHFLAMRQSK
jgi:hypothetical protein